MEDFSQFLVWCHVFLLLSLSHEGKPRVIGPSQPIVAIVGEDIILPCHLDPAMNASGMVLEWARPDLRPGFVHVRRNSEEYVADKQPSYRGRTSVSVDKLELGDASMKLSEVTRSDEGTYRCFFPQLGQHALITLVVGIVSSPVISSVNVSSSLVLQCEAKGWYPEPEVFWLDGEGNLLSAGPTETVRGPDDLYTVSRRLTVEKRDNFTCRVQQKNIKQTRETHFYVPGHFFTVQSSLGQTEIISIISIILGFLLVIILTVKYFRIKIKRRTAMKLMTLGKNTKTIQTNGSDFPMLPKQDEQLDMKYEVVHIHHQSSESEKMRVEGTADTP